MQCLKIKPTYHKLCFAQKVDPFLIMLALNKGVHGYRNILPDSISVAEVANLECELGWSSYNIPQSISINIASYGISVFRGILVWNFRMKYGWCC